MFQYYSPEEVKWDDFEDLILIPYKTDSKVHYTKSKISFIYFYDVDKKSDFIINCNHNDLVYNGTAWIKHINPRGKVFSYNSYLLRSFGINTYDIDLCSWLYTNDKIDINFNHYVHIYQNWYEKGKNINNIVPLVHLYVECIEIRNKFLYLLNDIEIDKSFEFYNNGVLPVFDRFNEHEIKIDELIVEKIFNKKIPYINTTYNIFTTTGRPSNSTNGINLAALNKKDGSRLMIKASDNSMLVEFDYNSFQVNLIANLINYKFNTDNIHYYLGQQYFNKSVLTEEEYLESKNITFQSIYGITLPKYKNIDFIKKVNTYRNFKWKQFLDNGFVELPISKRKLRKNNFNDINSNKLFNYIIQGTETEINVITLNRLQKYLKDKSSKLILYTYDSFLFDINKDDGHNILGEIKTILHYKNYKTKATYGKSYNHMEPIKI